MSLTVLFTHLKIIFLQYFQFSVISGIQTHLQSIISTSVKSFVKFFVFINFLKKKKNYMVHIN